ncbi:ABC transporter substrate-binding protein [Nonomuraea sp. NN258]|uniref:ABC transporter substrate-binding protein n=1 Tax=Nonomuraea antri TaxID=2730852 RepID=UPI00156A0CEE|nr:ABC transporter substrate-binding protein [Nonomuraea antri]NRQ31796.1 ABC transporter substrate-binding protein [Nonomuraea antri]
MRCVTLTRAQGNNRAVIDGSVAPEGFPLEFAQEAVLVQGFRKMVRDLAYDVSEMALTTYLCAREHGVRFNALPIFLVRGFHHGAILVRGDGSITEAGQLSGRRVGVNRGYTVTTGVWGRAILGTEGGLDLDSVTWVRSGDEHVAGYRPPANVVSAPAGRTLVDLLKAGELDAVIGVDTDDPDLAPLIADPVEAGFAALRSRGLYPINHLVVVKDDVLAERPGIAAAVFEAFAESKRRYVERLRSGEVADATDRMYARVLAETGADPLPYGLEPNRAVLEELMGHAVRQRILAAPARIEDLFAPATLKLAG